MHLSYRSEYANQAHQLAISPSKHLFVTNTGRLKYQKKSMDTSLANLTASAKKHVVHYLIRDHYSGVFYAEIHSSATLIPVEQFLFRAWSRKSEYVFRGLPDFISVPKVVSSAFPAIAVLIRAYGIGTISVTSGFQSGAIRDLKTWEQYIRYEINTEERRLLAGWTPAVTAEISSELNGEYATRNSKIEKWKYGIREIRVPPPDGWFSR